MTRLIALALSVLLVASGSGIASADQTDERLDRLFATLKTIADPTQGAAITETIWRIWYETKDDQARRLMAAGVEAMERDAYDAALADFDRLIDEAPGFAEGWNRRATLRYLMGELDASVRDIERTLELEPRHFGALSGLGLIYLQIGKEEAALKAFKRALEINPHLEGVRGNIRTLEQRLKDQAI